MTKFADHTRLMLFGGGPLPLVALEKFAEWAAQHARATSAKRVLYIAWASEVPVENAHAFRQALGEVSSIEVEADLHPPQNEVEAAAFVERLAQASAVFFSGGDQKRLRRAFDFEMVRSALHAAYARGVAFAGTSAGTAIMSELMILGDSDPGRLRPNSTPTGPGLGLLKGVIVDQHFIKRQRQNRLFSLVMEHPELVGLGIDEGAALVIEDGRYARALGPERVMMIESVAPLGTLHVSLIDDTHVLDLHPSRMVQAAELWSPRLGASAAISNSSPALSR